MVKLIDYLPDLYHGLKEMVKLTEAEDPEFNVLAQVIHQMLDNQFVVTANQQAIKRREQQLDIGYRKKTGRHRKGGGQGYGKHEVSSQAVG